MRSTIAFSAALACVALSAATCDAQDWPQWRGPNRDGRATGFAAPAAWPAELTKAWSVTVGDGVSSPALVGDRLYVFAMEDGQEVFRCLDAGSGEVLWSDSYEQQGATGPAGGFAGPRAAPAVADGKVVAFGVRGVVSCYDAATGDLLWRQETDQYELPRFYTSSSPLVVDGAAVVQIGGEDGGAVVAYDLESGEQRWKHEDGTAYASPAAMELDGTKLVVALTDDHVVALRAGDGAVLWEMAYAVEGRGYNAATPIVDGNTVVLTGSNRGVRAYRLSLADEASSAEELWANDDHSVQYNTPILRDGYLFGLSNRDVLFCVRMSSGETSWANPLGEAPAAPARGDARPDGDGQAGGQRPGGRGFGGRGGRRGRGGGRGGYGTITDVGSALVALTPNGKLTVFAPSGESFEPIASYQVAEEGAYGYPIASRDRIFVKDRDSATLWKVE